MIESKKVKLSTNWKPIKPTNPNQTENQGGAETIYTEEKVIEILTDMLTEVHNDEGIVYLWELFSKKPYSPQRYSEWIKDYSQVKKIQGLSESIKKELETRAVKGAITNKLNSTFTIFHLKNNYGWVDKMVNENKNANLNIETDDKWEFKELLKDNWLI